MGHPRHSRLHTPPITYKYCLQALTSQPLAHYHAAACTLPYSRLHTTLQLFAHNHAAACTLPYSRLHKTMQPLAHYHTTACTLLYSLLHTTMQIEGPSTLECWEGVPSPGGQWEEGHGLVQHVQGEHHQSSFLDHFTNANLQGVSKPYFRLDLIDPRSS